MKREEAVANALAVLTYCELKGIGSIRSFDDYQASIFVSIHFNKVDNEIHERREEISPLIMGGTIPRVYSSPNKDFETLDIRWLIG